MSDENAVNAVGIDWRTWVTALRSGKYKQGQGYLRSHRGYCCWGVACDIVNPNGWKPTKDAGDYIFEYGDNGNQGIPPDSVREALGVEKLGTYHLMNMNDCDLYSFNDIANEIERKMTNDAV